MPSTTDAAPEIGAPAWYVQRSAPVLPFSA